MPTDPTNSAERRDRVQERLRQRWGTVIRDLERELTPGSYYDPQTSTSIGRQTTEFREWMEFELDRQVVEPVPTTRHIEVGTHWSGDIIKEFYEHGLRLADEDIREAGGDLSQTFPDAILRQDKPRFGGEGLHHEYLEEEYGEIYNDLKDAARETTKQTYRAYRDAARQNATADEALEAVIDRIEKVGKTRTDLVAQAKLIGTINDAILARYEQLGIESVAAEIEDVSSEPDVAADGGVAIAQHADHDGDVRKIFTTAGDRRVCTRCSLYENNVYTVAEIRAGSAPEIPQHPRCRCRWRVFDVTDLGWT